MKKNIIIVILLIIVIGLAGYIGYDKYLIKEEQIKTGNETLETTETLLSKEEALAMGKEKYKYIRDGLYECGYTQIKTEENKKYSYTNTGMTIAGETGAYLKITNISEIKNNLTNHGFSDWIYFMEIKKDGNDFYINYSDGCGGDPTYGYDKYEMIISKMTEDMVIYDITEKFYKENNNEISEEIDESENFKTKLILVKEDNTWKIDEYTNYTLKYILK
ncbi:MAG: hypothetical protein IKG27_03595 [Bacilli bacterium]|nr:hypothetical protein [Bacilli bacterium]